MCFWMIDFKSKLRCDDDVFDNVISCYDVLLVYKTHNNTAIFVYGSIGWYSFIYDLIIYSN